MAKEKRSAADLDAELAALEAELAALENKPKKAKEKPAEKPKAGFAMPKLGKKDKPAPAPAAAPTPPPQLPPQHPTAAIEPPAAPVYDASVWRQDGDAWVRVIPEARVPVVRRVLDENGNTVREEPAEARDIEEARGVKAERGIGRLLRRK